MNTQTHEPQLGFWDENPERKHIVWLEDFLRSFGDWRLAAKISMAHGGLTDREVRAAASASDWIISGQLGYKHIECATTDEIDHAAAWLESQAGKMQHRATRIRQNAHKLIG